MGWFSRRRKPQAQRKAEIWEKCPACSAHVIKEEWAQSWRVCPRCNYHDRLTCDERLRILVDEDSFEELFADIGASDPLAFADAKGTYAAKLQSTVEETGLQEAVKTGRAEINGTDVVTAVMDFRFFGGSLSSGAGEKIFRAATYALKRRLPYVMVCASGGARMQEGIVSLMQMAKTCVGVSRLHAGRVPYISVLTNPTFGGVSASFAMMGDVNMAEPGALIGFAGRRVIEQTIKQELPPDFQTAEYLLQHGFVDMIVNRKDMKDTLHKVMGYWLSR